jgi:Zn-dependent protease
MEQAFLIAFYLIILVYSIILHEMSHGVVALWLGDKTAKFAGRLSLEPMRHIDPIGSVILPLVMILTTGFAFGWARPVPYNPHNLRWKKWGEVVVAFSGPATNFLIALIAAIIGAMISISAAQKSGIFNLLMQREWMELVNSVVGSPGAIIYTMCAMAIFWNVLLGVFNLIPIPPLDGSKLTYTFFRVKPETQFFLERWGFLIILLLLFTPPFGFIFTRIVYGFLNAFMTISL